MGENFFSRLQHIWELFHNDASSDNNNKNPNNDKNTLAFVHGPTSPPPPVEEQDYLQNVFNNSYTYIVTLTFPASSLLSSYSRFHFSVSVTRYHDLFPVNASQLVVVKRSRDK